MKIKTLGWLISPCIALAACTETALDYRSAEGTVVIAPEWGAFACKGGETMRVKVRSV